MEFDPTKQYGDFIEIVPLGQFSVFHGRVFCGDWNKENIKTVRERLESEYKSFIPLQYLAFGRTKIIIHAPIKGNDPLRKAGSIAWKFTPDI